MKQLAILLALLLALSPATVSLASATVEPTPAITADGITSPDAPPTSPEALRQFINRRLSEAAQTTKDPWLFAILDDGAQDAALVDGTITFMVRSFRPDLSALDLSTTAGMAQLATLLAMFDLPCMLPVQPSGNTYVATDTDIKNLVKTLTKAAGAAKKAWGGKVYASALLAALANDSLTGATLGEYQPLFATARNAKLKTVDGPHALTLTVAFANSATLLNQAYADAKDQLAKQGGAYALSEDAIAQTLIAQAIVQAKTLQKKASAKQTFVLDVDQVLAAQPTNEDAAYVSLLSDYRDLYNATLAELVSDASQMPDSPALELPDTGRMSGSTSGTKVTFKTPKDGYARYLQMRSVDTDEAIVTAFFHSGKSVTVRVPQGFYTVLLAVGEQWYGTGELFGSTGSYVRTQEIEILSSRYYHTITLGGVTDGNMSTYGADTAAFQ